MRQVIVTDQKYRMALAPVRTLSRLGCAVTGTELEGTPGEEILGFYSNCLDDRRILPAEENALTAALIDLCREKTENGRKPVILPVGRKVLNVLQNHSEVAEYADFIVPDREIMELADDKWRLYNLARELGIPAPKTTALSEHDSINELSASVNYPAFIKLRNGELLGLKPRDRYEIARSAEELTALYPKMEEKDADPVVQEYAAGRDVGIAVVMDKNGRLRDYIAYESLREFPASGGPTCLLRTVESPKMLEYAEKLLTSIGYRGMAMLDFRGSAEEPMLLEINPRVWGSANVCDIASSSYFLSYVQAASGEEPRFDVHKTPLYQVGVMMRFSPQDALSYFSYLKNGSGFFGTTLDYLRTAFDFSIIDGFNVPEDREPHRRYIKNLFKRKGKNHGH